MADYGVTRSGFVRPRMGDIRRDIIAALKNNLSSNGFDADIETRPDSLYGLIIGTFAEREAAMWEACEQVYFAMYPNSAVGTSLDNVAAFAGLTRLMPEPSSCYIVLYGAQNTTVPTGTQVKNTVTGTVWELTADTTISQTAATDISLAPTVQDSTTYTITIDSTNYSYTSDSTALLSEIIGGLVAALAGANMTVTSDGASIRLVAATAGTNNVSVTGNLTITELGTRGLFETAEPIAESVMPGDLSQMITLVPGLARANNLISGSVGSAGETDAELRMRYVTGLFRRGRATLPAIGANVRNQTDGVTSATVYQNASDTIGPNGLVPHSIHVIAQGGLDIEVAKSIYNNVAAGIDTNGAIVKTFNTDEGQQTIKFDRPTEVYIWCKATVTTLPDSEQPFPADGLQRIEDALVERGLAQIIGEDVITQRFIGPCFRATGGIATLKIEFDYSTNASHTPSYTEGNITINRDELAIFDRTRVTVTV